MSKRNSLLGFSQSVLPFPKRRRECIEVEIIQKGPIAIGYGGTIKINANIISNSAGSLEVNWQKTHNNCSATLMINCIKYSGSSCDVNNPQLVINNFDKEDAGIYKVEVISPTETTSSPGILLELYGDETDSLSKEGNNFFRLYLLCQKIATKAVRFFFDSKVPGLDAFLKKHKSNLTSQRSVYRCTKDQEAKLFPGGKVVVVSTDFDLTLLYNLIRNLLTTIPAPTCGWGKLPLPGHLNETDHIEIIRHLRNILTHHSDLEICDTDFSTHWTDLSEAINILSKGSLSTDVESIRMKKFDKCSINEMEEDLRKARHIPMHIKKGHTELITTWRLEDKLFYETSGFTEALKLVQSENYMTIIGGPGSGKTATARHIALQLEKQGWEIVPVCRLKEIIKYGDRGQKQVFVLDDVLGTFSVDMPVYIHCINYKEPIFKAIGGTSKLLFTCRKSVYKEVLKPGLFVTENIVDLQRKDNQLTETEKMTICKNHCEAKGLNQDLYTSLSFTNANHMFPFLCKLFSMKERYQRLGESFFNKPFDYFIEGLDTLQTTNTIQYAVLVLCLVNKGKLSVELLPHKHMKTEVFNNCGVNLGTPDKQIKDAIYHMSETYFTKLGTKYTFAHDFIFEAIAYHYGRQNKHQILKCLSSNYIANKVRVYEQASNEDLCIHISEDMYLPLAERLYTDIQSMNLFDVFMNKSLLHGPFRDVFEGMLRRKPFDEFESLILRKHENIRHFLQKHFNKRIKNLSDIIERMRLNLLFDMVSGEEKDEVKFNVRVISWIINYGHTHLLQEIVNHVNNNNLSTSLIFGSNIMENTRLLLLGCFSNMLDMVELILKYVTPECIDMDLMSCGTSYDTHFAIRMRTPLTVACEIGNLCIVKALLRNHADINKYDSSKSSPLIAASAAGHCEVVKCLLSSGAYINLHHEDRHSALYEASLQGYCDVVKCLLSFDADTNLCAVNGWSPLYIAALIGHCDVVKCLIDSGADINFRNDDGQSPLFAASKYRHCDVIECLLSSGADISLGDKQELSPLHLASICGHYDAVLCLLKFGADINLTDKDGHSPLYAALVEGYCEVVKCFLSSSENINLCEDGQSPLYTASEGGHCDVVKWLISSGADINLGKDGQSPLFTASMYGHCEVVECLLSSGADINLPDKDGHSPLYLALVEGYCEVVKCFLSSSENINLCEDGQSPLYTASVGGHCDVVKWLISSGADISLGKDGWSPLFIASMCGHCEVVECLLSSGADINLGDKLEQSPLFIASMYGHCDVVECLLRSSADINLRNKDEQSPLFIASQHGCSEVVNCLLRFGADANLCNQLGQEPLYIASEKGHYGIVECLLNSSANVNLFDECGQSPLFVASMYGRYDVIKYLLCSGADLNLRDEQGQSQLFKASWQGHCDVVKCLLSFSADINLCDKRGQSPLLIASWQGHCDIVKCLLSSGADINLRDVGGQSPLIAASSSGYYDIVRLLTVIA